jgi:hypothetical protein
MTSEHSVYHFDMNLIFFFHNDLNLSLMSVVLQYDQFWLQMG